MNSLRNTAIIHFGKAGCFEHELNALDIERPDEKVKAEYSVVFLCLIELMRIAFEVTNAFSILRYAKYLAVLPFRW